MQTTIEPCMSPDIPIWTAPDLDSTTAALVTTDAKIEAIISDDVPIWTAPGLDDTSETSSWTDTGEFAGIGPVVLEADITASVDNGIELQHIPTTTFDPLSECYLDNSYSKGPKRWRVLSVDGGGLRGVIPARILGRIWEATGRKPLHESFPIMAGNSVGGLIVVGLNAPDADGNALYTPWDLEDTIIKEKDNIFPSSWFNMGLTGPRYPAEGIEGVVKEYMGEIKMRDLLAKEIVCPSFCTLCDRMEYFSKVRSQMDMNYSNDYAWEAVRATTAAPTYFPAFNRGGCSLIDGFMQNDTVHLAYWRAVKLGADPRNMTVVSLGTGRVDCNMDTSNWGLMDWASNLVEVVCKGQSDGSQLIVDDILGGPESHQYYRIQPTIDRELQKFDDGDEDKMARRIEAADQWIEENPDTFREIVMQCEPRPSDDNE